MNPIIVMEKFKEKFHNCKVTIYPSYGSDEIFEYRVSFSGFTRSGGFCLSRMNKAEVDKFLDFLSMDIAHSLADNYFLGIQRV